jgi:hypothetical protein
MTTKSQKTLFIISFSVMLIATFFLMFLYFQNNNLTPFILHYIYNFGDFLGNRNSLLYIIIGSWVIFILNLYLSKVLKSNFKTLADLLKISNLIISSFYLIISIQVFLNNI